MTLIPLMINVLEVPNGGPVGNVYVWEPPPAIVSSPIETVALVVLEMYTLFPNGEIGIEEVPRVANEEEETCHVVPPYEVPRFTCTREEASFTLVSASLSRQKTA